MLSSPLSDAESAAQQGKGKHRASAQGLFAFISALASPAAKGTRSGEEVHRAHHKPQRAARWQATRGLTKQHEGEGLARNVAD